MFFLNTEFNIHPGKPPGIAASCQTLSSVNTFVAVKCSLQNEFSNERLVIS